MSKKNSLYAVALITSLFFLWGISLNLNSILVPHLKKACQLTDLQSAFVDSAYYIAYFIVAIPAGLFMHKYGYKSGIVLGLLLFAIGAFLFYPAAQMRIYGFFLFALFIIASGCGMLETAANPYINNLGDPEHATWRINFAQSFNGLAAFLAPIIGGTFILSGKNLTAAQEHAMSAQQLNSYLQGESNAVKVPYIIIASVVLLVAILFWRTNLPDIKEHSEKGDTQTDWGSIFKEKNLVRGVGGIFFYVGAQAAVTSFFIRYSKYVGSILEKEAASLLALAMLGFMIGRFAGSVAMRFMRPVFLLVTYSIINCGLLVLAYFLDGRFSVYAIMGVPFFMSIMFPTIFSLSIRGLGEKTKKGSSLLIMGIVGGAVIPLLLGRVSDMSNIRIAYLMPLICFVYILYFALTNIRVKSVQQQAISH
ncbi:MAG TPA: L-fucose:H+ symporter permease [Mucilaginibacter sp.]|jgi:FHS family L-fucose permease-like MFS transporter|nr:L-fucose:H+ symporter permease [Mucilaginibacter sp.]